MSERNPTFPGWYPDDETGGTKYWDGSRWTGDARPRRKPFAAPAGSGPAAYSVIGFGVFFVVMSFFASDLNDGTVSTIGLFFGLFIPGLAAIVGGVYMQRGKGPSTVEVERRLAEERKAVKSKRRSANWAGFAAGLGRIGQPRTSTPTDNESAAAAQINAIANPETARALQNLQNLLYTQAITDAEYQAAKDKLLGTQALNDSFAQIAKLAELHDAGILGDVEFAAAKAKALGI